VRRAAGQTFDARVGGLDCDAIVTWFDEGGALKIAPGERSDLCLDGFRGWVLAAARNTEPWRVCSALFVSLFQYSLDFVHGPVHRRHGLLERGIAFHTPKNVDRHFTLRVPTPCIDSWLRASHSAPRAWFAKDMSITMAG